MKMQIHRVFLCMLVSMMLFSCVGIVPKQENLKTGLVFFISECSVDNFDEVFVAYDIIYDTNKSIRIDPTRKFTLRDDIPPGVHVIDSIRTINKSSSETKEDHKLGIKFSVNPGEVTVFPFKLIVEKKIEGVYAYIYTRINILTKKDAEEFKRYFTNQKNSDGWKIQEIFVK